MSAVITAIVGYLFGCINGAQIIGKLKNVDIRNSGNKNAGASNTAILLGMKYGVIVGLIDILKAVIPILILKTFTHDYFLLYLLGAFIILGHNYPFTMKFKGGKGTASVIGAVLAINWHIGIIALVMLLALTMATDYLVVGVLFFYLVFVLATSLIGYGQGAIIISVLLTILSVIKHRENYKRMINKTEVKVSSMFSKKRK